METGAAVDRAAAAIAGADAVIATAGAGMGVDSGLPDFRGDEGFWRAYPPYRDLGRSFVEMANPAVFRDDPRLGWGFYGHRRALYRSTVPHAGFAVLRRWIEQAPGGGAVFTSNVDGQFQAAGMAAPVPLVECHGSIHVEQCLHGCGHPFWESTAEVDVDHDTMRAVGPLPTCPGCGGLARPNILMFGDGGWDPTRTHRQEQTLARWLDGVVGRVVVVECGAGTAIASVRRFGEHLVRTLGATLVRINPRDPEVPPGQVGLPLRAGEALARLAAARD